jgi:hypothetical protein
MKFREENITYVNQECWDEIMDEQSHHPALTPQRIETLERVAKAWRALKKQGFKL